VEIEGVTIGCALLCLFSVLTVIAVKFDGCQVRVGQWSRGGVNSLQVSRRSPVIKGVFLVKDDGGHSGQSASVKFGQGTVQRAKF